MLPVAKQAVAPQARRSDAARAEDRHVLRVSLLLALATFVICLAGRPIGGSNLDLPVVWVASGVLFGLLVRYPPAQWLAPILGQTVAMTVAIALYPAGFGLPALVIPILIAIQAIEGAWLIHKIGIWRIEEVWQLGAVAVVGAVVAAAGASLVFLAGFGFAPSAGSAAALQDLGRGWWVGALAGIALTAPGLLSTWPTHRMSFERKAELGAVAALGVITGLAIVVPAYSDPFYRWVALFVLFLLLLWTAIRFGVAWTAAIFTLFVTFWVAVLVNGPSAFDELAASFRSHMTILQLSIVIIALAVYAVALTEERRVISEVRESAAYDVVESLLDNSDAMIYVKEYGGPVEGAYTLANPTFLASLNKSRRQVIGRSDVAVVGREAARVQRNEDREVLATGRPKVFTGRSPYRNPAEPNAAAPVLLATKFPLPAADGTIRAVGTIAFDITEHRRRERLMHLAFAQSPVPMARLAWRDGAAGEVLDANQSLAWLLGVPEESLRGHPLDSYVHPDERGHPLVPPAALSDTLAPRRRESRLVRADGEPIWAAVTATVVEPTGEDDPGDAFALIVLEDITARRHAEHALTHQALHDPLTGLPNRSALQDRLTSALSRLWRARSYLAVLFCDLDGFKHLNDSLGHRAGDQMLVSVAERLRNVARPSDTIARLGGDEFVLVCEELSSPAEAMEIGERIRDSMRSPFVIDGREYGMTVSVGVTTTTDAAAKAEDLLRRADLAMYKAKDSGRNRVESYVKELEQKVAAQLEMTEQVRRAVAENRLEVRYQPIVDLASGKISGFEALARMRDEDGNLVLPSDFIGVAEETGLIVQLGERVLEIALDQLAQWHEDGFELLMNINVSPRQLSRQALAPDVFERLVARGIAPNRVCLEVTEAAVIDASGPTMVTLRRLRSYGVRIAIDDFGTGYSNLTTLKYLPADVLKVDKSFVSGLGHDIEDTAIVRAVVQIAHELGRTVVAEGVETEEQLEILTQMGCDKVQGYRYGRPVPPDEATEMLVASQRTGSFGA